MDQVTIRCQDLKQYLKHKYGVSVRFEGTKRKHYAIIGVGMYSEGLRYTRWQSIIAAELSEWFPQTRLLRSSDHSGKFLIYDFWALLQGTEDGQW